MFPEIRRRRKTLNLLINVTPHMKFRAFIAAEVGAWPELIGVVDVLRQIPADLKLVEPRNIHITLRFLGDIDEELIEGITTSMQRSVDGVRPFKLKLRNMGAFPNLNYIKVVWVGLENPENFVTIARRLNNELIELGFKPETRGFSPHLTLARVKTRRGKGELQKILHDYGRHDFGELDIDCITLKKSDLTSQGPIYTTVKEIKFE